MPKFVVTWTNVVSYSCSHTVEAETAEEAEKICRGLDSNLIQHREESDNEDREMEAEEE